MFAKVFTTALLAATALAATTTTTSSSAPPSPTQSGLIASCNKFYDVQSGDTCQAIVNKYSGVTLKNFYSWNPAVGSSCSNLQVGYYVCVGVSPASSTSTTSTPTPSPTEPGTASSCDAFYKVNSGDTCQGIVNAYKSFTLSQFYSWNTAINGDCTNLQLGFYYCVGVKSSTTTTTTSTTSKSSSTSIKPSSTSTSSSKTTSTTSKTSSSSSKTSTTLTTTTKPTTTSKASTTSTTTSTTATNQPQQSGIVSNCNSFYKVVTGDDCGTVEKQFGITDVQFKSWNTGVNSDCTNLWANYYCCVGV